MELLRIALLVFVTMFGGSKGLSAPSPDTSPALQEASPVLEVDRYRLDIRLDYDAESLFATTDITLRNDGTGPAWEASLLLHRLLRVKSVEGPGGEALDFQQPVRSIKGWERFQVRHILIRLPEAVGPGERITLRLAYEGTIWGYQETGMLYVRDRIDPAYTIIRKDAYAYPEPGLPDREELDGRGLARFAYEATVDVPDSLTVANGGELIEIVRQDGRATYRYRNLLPAWRMDFAIAPYTVLEEEGFRVFAFPKDREGGKRVLEAMKQTIATFTAWFGPLKVQPAYTVIEIPDGFGSQADVSSILQTASAFTDQGQMHQLYHEIAHLWSVDPAERPSPRWQEGLATFLEWHMVDVVEGNEQGENLAYVFDWFRDRAWEEIRSDSLATVHPLADYGRIGRTGLSYSVGMLAFTVLHELVGPAVFNRAIATFYDRFGDREASLRDYVGVLDETSGEIDLEAFYRDWFFGTGFHEHLRQGLGIEEMAAIYRW